MDSPIEIYCSTEIIERDEGSGYEVARPLIFIPVEGYNWISHEVAYYKSSGQSNTLTDTDFKTRVRKFMWFPTIGLLSENSFMAELMSQTEQPHNPGYILKYINLVFKNYGMKKSTQPFWNYFLRPPFTSTTSEYGMVSPYLQFINFENILSKMKSNQRLKADERARAVTKINEFTDFLTVMTNYCYNWRQIQDSIRLSVNNKVDGVDLFSSDLADICNFILQSHLINEYNSNTVDLQLTTEKLPFFNVEYVPSEVLLRSENDKQINSFLLYNSAINYELMIKKYEPSDNFKTYYDTMYLGKPFDITGGYRRKYRHSKNKKQKTKRRNKNINRKKSKRRRLLR
jgi:hypothetical protein